MSELLLRLFSPGPNGILRPPHLKVTQRKLSTILVFMGSVCGQENKINDKSGKTEKLEIE